MLGGNIIYEGPRGAQFILNKSGKRTYLDKKAPKKVSKKSPSKRTPSKKRSQKRKSQKRASRK